MPISISPVARQMPQNQISNMWNSNANAARQGNCVSQPPRKAAISCWIRAGGGLQNSSLISLTCSGGQKRIDKPEAIDSNEPIARTDDADDEQAPGSKTARWIDPEPTQRVQNQNVAMPEQIRVQQSKDEKPRHPPVVDPSGPAAALGDSRCHEKDPRAEQQGEDRHEFLIDEQVHRRPDEKVASGGRSNRGGVEIRREGHREHLDVHQQDAQHGAAAKHIERLRPIRFRDRCNGLHGRRLQPIL